MNHPIRHEVKINSSPKTVYAALTDGNQFSAMSGGAPAEISGEAGGAFSVFGGMILGRQIELVPSQRVVQAWRVKLGPEGLYSVVRFDVSADGTGTKLAIEHAGYPEDQREPLTEGWLANYGRPLKKFLES
jgi:activator of HSP90 ATPase